MTTTGMFSGAHKLVLACDACKWLQCCVMYLKYTVCKPPTPPAVLPSAIGKAMLKNSCAQCRRLPTAGLQAQSCERLWPTAPDSCVLKHSSMCTGIRSMCRSDVLSVGVDSGFDHGKLIDRQRLNHFPRHMELTRKDLMVKNLKKWKRAMVKQGKPVNDFWPTTFRLPEVLLPCLARAAEQCRNNI